MPISAACFSLFPYPEWRTAAAWHGLRWYSSAPQWRPVLPADALRYSAVMVANHGLQASGDEHHPQAHGKGFFNQLIAPAFQQMPGGGSRDQRQKTLKRPPRPYARSGRERWIKDNRPPDAGMNAVFYAAAAVCIQLFRG